MAYFCAIDVIGDIHCIKCEEWFTQHSSSSIFSIIIPEDLKVPTIIKVLKVPEQEVLVKELVSQSFQKCTSQLVQLHNNLVQEGCTRSQLKLDR